MKSNKIKEKLEKIISPKPSGLMGEIKARKEKEVSLDWSFRIALKVLNALKEQQLSQKDLALQLRVTPQRITQILKGRENLTLETIAAIQKVLKIKLLEVPMNTPSLSENTQNITNEVVADGTHNDAFKTGKLMYLKPLYSKTNLNIEPIELYGNNAK